MAPFFSCLSGMAEGVILGKRNGGFVGECWRRFWERLVMVVYDDFQRCLMVIFWGGSCWLLGLFSDDVRMVLEWFSRFV